MPLDVFLKKCSDTRISVQSIRTEYMYNYRFITGLSPLPSARQHPSYGDCLEVKRKYYHNCSVLGCATIFTVSSTLIWAVLTGPADWVCHVGTLMLCVEVVA